MQILAVYSSFWANTTYAIIYMYMQFSSQSCDWISSATQQCVYHTLDQPWRSSAPACTRREGSSYIWFTCALWMCVHMCMCSVLQLSPGWIQLHSWGVQRCSGPTLSSPPHSEPSCRTNPPVCPSANECVWYAYMVIIRKNCLGSSWVMYKGKENQCWRRQHTQR